MTKTIKLFTLNFYTSEKLNYSRINYQEFIEKWLLDNNFLETDFIKGENYLNLDIVKQLSLNRLIKYFLPHIEDITTLKIMAKTVTLVCLLDDFMELKKDQPLYSDVNNIFYQEILKALDKNQDHKKLKNIAALLIRGLAQSLYLERNKIFPENKYREHFARSVKEWLFLGVFRETDSTFKKELFFKVKPYLSGMMIIMNVVEFAYKINIPEDFWNSKDYRELRLIASTIAGIANDCFSYFKEKNNPNINNLGKIIKGERNTNFLDDELIILEIADYYNNLVLFFFEKLENFKNKYANKNIDQYIKPIIYPVFGWIYYQLESPRYQKYLNSTNLKFETIQINKNSSFYIENNNLLRNKTNLKNKIRPILL